MNASHIRLDLEMHGVFKNYSPTGSTATGSGVDEVVELSRRYDIPVTGHPHRRARVHIRM